MPQSAETRPEPLVAVIIVSWNSRDDTLACLASAAASTYPMVRLVVVDNGSTDGSPDAIQRCFPSATLVALADNQCFTYAANRGIEAAQELGASLFLLLNSDAVLDSECVAHLAAAALADPRVGVLCPKVLFLDDPTRIQYAGGTLSLVTGRIRARGFGEVDRGQYDTPVEVGFASACCALIRREAVERVGLFDESFYHGGEDLDFCHRVREAGLRILCEPRAKAWHRLASSSGGYDSPFYVFYQARNRFLLLRKHLTVSQALTTLPFQVAHILRRAAELAVAGRWSSIVALVRGVLDAARDLRGRSPLYPTPAPTEAALDDSRPMILVVNPVGVEAGGVQRILLELFRELVPKGIYRFTVAVPRIGPYEKEYQKLGIRVYAFPVSIIRRSLNPLTIARTVALFVPNVLTLRRIIRRHGVALVHTQKMNTLVGDVAARLARIPSVHSLHEIPLTPRWLYRMVGAAIYRLASRIIVTCESSRELVPGLARHDPRVVTIYNGFDLAQIDGESSPEEIRQEFGAPPGTPLVGTGGRLAPSKGYEVFLEAAALLVRGGTRARFLIVGDIIAPEDAPYKEKIYRMVRELGLEKDLVLTGFRNDYHAVIAAMDVFVVPSLYDTLPLMVIEAMALARPVVASAVGGIPEQVDDGRTGLLVPPGDPGAMAEAIRRLLSDPDEARRFGLEGRRRAQSVFSNRSYAEATCRLYDELLARSGVAG